MTKFHDNEECPPRERRLCDGSAAATASRPWSPAELVALVFFLAFVMVLVSILACSAKVASKESPQRAGRDAISDQSDDLDVLDAKEADIDGIDAKGAVTTGIDASDDSAGNRLDGVTGENIINLVLGDNASRETLESWLGRLAAAISIIGAIALAVARAYVRVKADLRELVKIVEQHADPGGELKGKIAKSQARKTSLGKLVRKVTTKERNRRE